MIQEASQQEKEPLVLYVPTSCTVDRGLDPLADLEQGVRDGGKGGGGGGGGGGGRGPRM